MNEPCPICGGPTHSVLLIDSEEINCDDWACSWEGVVIDTLDDGGEDLLS